MALRDDWRRVRAIAMKDLTTELRAKAGFNGVASLAVTILIVTVCAVVALVLAMQGRLSPR